MLLHSQGIDVLYEIQMTNGNKGDLWHYHFSVDEFGKPSQAGFSL